MITIIDYGVGNINAFVNVYKRGNVPVKIAKTASDLEGAEKLILPGVGSFDHAMRQLNASGMRNTLDEMVLEKKVPVIGICVGMQMMGNKSEEGSLQGLKWIDADVRKFDESKIDHITKLPHMGWNDVVPKENNTLFSGLGRDSIFYFLHSFYFRCFNPLDIIATSYYGENFTCAVQHNNIFGIQFHPEKSHEYGEKLLLNFAAI